MNKILFYTIAFSINFFSCTSNNKNCELRESNYGGDRYFSNGCRIDGLEEGDWIYLDNNKEIIEKGKYKNGIRVGSWSYPQNLLDTVIIWRGYVKEKLDLVFNIPEGLEVVGEEPDFIKFSNRDSSNLLNIALSVVHVDRITGGIENFYKYGEDDIKSRNMTFRSSYKTIRTNNRKYFVNEYTIYPGIDSFHMTDIYTMINKNEMIEITCRYDARASNTARIIFYSIIPNCFYKGKRFLDPFEPTLSKLKNYC